MKVAQLTMNGERLNDWRTQKKRVHVKNDIFTVYESLFKTNFEFFFSESFIYNLMNLFNQKNKIKCIAIIIMN